MGSSSNIQRLTDNEQIIEFIRNNQQYATTKIILDKNGEIENPWTILEEISNNLKAPTHIRERSQHLYELANRSFV